MENQLAEHEQALWILKTGGSQPVAAIAEEMEVTNEGARFHLLKLEKDGLVQAKSKAEGRGRPKKIWSLTQKGHGRFPDTHADMTVNLIEMMRQNLGEDAVQEVVKANEQRTLSEYKAALKGCDTLKDKIAKLTEVRRREGYMAEYKKVEDGFLFIENHCPICAAAETCQQFCKAELNIFKSVLGEEVDIKREEHIIKGARRCAYRITE